MKAIVVTDQAAGTAGMKLVERPDPDAARLASLEGANYGDVVVEVHASGFTGNELEWPSTWIDRLGRDRTPSIPGHEVAGVVTSLSYGATGLSVGQRVFGLTDWTRDGTLAEYTVVEARNLAPLPGDVDFTVGAGVAMTGLTAWQGLFEHGGRPHSTSARTSSSTSTTTPWKPSAESTWCSTSSAATSRSGPRVWFELEERW